jgi:hypothetical protein
MGRLKLAFRNTRDDPSVLADGGIRDLVDVLESDPRRIAEVGPSTRDDPSLGLTAISLVDL